MDRQPPIGTEEEGRQSPAPRHAYRPPELMDWGTLSEITQKVGYQGASDGGRFPFGYKTA